MNNKITQSLTLLLWTGLMASSFLVAEFLVPYANPIASTGLRFILACLLMLPFIYTRVRPFISVAILAQYGLISLFLVLFFIGLFESLKTTTALNTSVIYSIVPVLSVVLSYFWLKVSTPLSKLMGFVSGILGAVWVLLASKDIQLVNVSWHPGDGIFLLSCCCLVLHIVLIKKWQTGLPPSITAFLILLTGGIIMLPLMFIAGDLEQVAWLDLRFWQSLLYLTVFATLATFFLQQYLIQKVGPNLLLAFTYLIPTLVAVADGLLMSEQLWYAQPGIALTVVALYLISRNSIQPDTVIQ